MNEINKEIGRRIKKVRLEKGLTVEELGKKIGVAGSTISRYENGGIGNIKLPVIESIAKTLKVNPAWLVLKNNDPYFPNIHPIETRTIPMLGEIAAGEPIMVAEDCRAYLVVNQKLHVDFCLRVKGDSMIDARIFDGDLVFIRKQPTVENGEIAAVAIDDEATLKRFYRNGDGIILKQENSKYQPRFYTEKDFKEIRVLGKAIFFQSKI